MKTLNEFVESYLNYKSAESAFSAELCDTLKIKPTNIKYICITNAVKDTKFVQIVKIGLIGVNKIRSEDISKIKGLSIITPKTLEIEVGEIHL